MRLLRLQVVQQIVGVLHEALPAAGALSPQPELEVVRCPGQRPAAAVAAAAEESESLQVGGPRTVRQQVQLGIINIVI